MSVKHLLSHLFKRFIINLLTAKTSAAKLPIQGGVVCISYKSKEYRDHPNYDHNPPDFKKILNKYMQVYENKINY